MIFAGLDVHKDFSVITMMDERGNEIIKQRRIKNDGEMLTTFKNLGEPVSLAMEASRSWQWLYDLLEGNGIDVKLIHPLKTKAIASAKIKNDKIDSRILAHLLRANLIPESYVPGRQIRMNREMLRYRASLVRIKTGIKNRIHTILAKNNIHHDFTDLFGRKGKEFLRGLELADAYKLALDGYLTVLEGLEEEIKLADKQITATAKEDEDAKLLMTIPGVSYYSALLIKSEIGEINRFPSAKQLCSYAGLVPSTYSSGNTLFHGHITKQGSKWLRWVVSEAINHAVIKPGHLQEFYIRLAKKKGNKLAKVAAERKLLEWIYHILKEGYTFQDMEKRAIDQR